MTVAQDTQFADLQILIARNHRVLHTMVAALRS